MKINIKKIRNELKRRGWAQADLARSMHMTPQAISVILRRQRAPFSTMDKLAKALDMEPKDILT